MTDDPPVESIAERSVEQVNETHVEQVNETHVEQVVEQVAVLETAEASPVIIKPVVEDPAVRKMDKVFDVFEVFLMFRLLKKSLH